MSLKTRHLLGALAAAGFCWLIQLLLLPSMGGLWLGFIAWLALVATLFLIPIKHAGSIWMTFAGICLFCLSANLYLCYSVVIVEGESMLPTLQPGDVLLIEDNASAELLGIYVVHGKNSEIVKRLVGKPRDTLDVRYGRMFNGESEVHPRLGGQPDEWNKDRPVSAGYRFGEPLKLDDDEYFFLSDNPQKGKDSRHTGPYGEDAIRGRVVLKLKPGVSSVE